MPKPRKQPLSPKAAFIAAAKAADTPYHLVPNGKTGIEAFAVIREAMKQKKMVALGRLVMSAAAPP
jgi:non-homologous end joining protein Ku